MKTIILHGEMRRLFGTEFKFNVRSPAEAVKALCATVKGFRAYLHSKRGAHFKIFVSGRNVSDSPIDVCSDREVIRIAPTIQGAGGAGRIILGAALIAFAGSGFALAKLAFAGTTAGAIAGGMGVSLVLGGVAQLLTPTPTADPPNERPENTPNSNFDGPVNTTAQGQCVPLAYGRILAGSAVISAGVFVQ